MVQSRSRNPYMVTQSDVRFGPSGSEPTEEEIVLSAKQVLKEIRMNATRCKMKLTSISEAYNNGRTVKFQPVQSGSEENKAFYAATPSGSCEFTVSEQAAKSLGLDAGKLGAEFYVDFTPAC